MAAAAGTPSRALITAGVVAVGHVLLTGFGTSLGYGGTVPPEVGGWGPTVLFAALATWLGVRSRGFGPSA